MILFLDFSSKNLNKKYFIDQIILLRTLKINMANMVDEQTPANLTSHSFIIRKRFYVFLLLSIRHFLKEYFIHIGTFLDVLCDISGYKNGI